MKALKDLQSAIHAGQRPIVTFKKGIEDKEAYPEAGMRGRILGVTPQSCGEVFAIEFDFSEFDAHNLPLESSNYFDKSGSPTLTARQAGYYSPQERIYFDLDEDLSLMLEVAPSSVSPLLEEYVSLNDGDRPASYVQWLEALVIASRVPV